MTYGIFRFLWSCHKFICGDSNYVARSQTFQNLVSWVLCVRQTLWMSCIHLIAQDNSPFHPYATIMHKPYQGIQSMRLEYPVCSHSREGNNSVDLLAKMGSSSTTPLVKWNTCPHQLNSPLLTDALGVSFPIL